jgi:hypothetical protein
VKAQDVAAMVVGATTHGRSADFFRSAAFFSPNSDQRVNIFLVTKYMLMDQT